jgi:hypothetical protein
MLLFSYSAVSTREAMKRKRSSGSPQETLRHQRLDFGERLRRAGSVFPIGAVQQLRHLFILEGRRAKYVGDSEGKSDQKILMSLP